MTYILKRSSLLIQSHEKFMNCLPEVIYGMFCSQRLMQLSRLAKEQGGLRLSEK